MLAGVSRAGYERCLIFNGVESTTPGCQVRFDFRAVAVAHRPWRGLIYLSLLCVLSLLDPNSAPRKFGRAHTGEVQEPMICYRRSKVTDSRGVFGSFLRRGRLTVSSFTSSRVTSPDPGSGRPRRWRFHPDCRGSRMAACPASCRASARWSPAGPWMTGCRCG